MNELTHSDKHTFGDRMCLLFFETKKDPEPDEYKMVMINVRDETFTRPAKHADYWDEDPSILGGEHS